MSDSTALQSKVLFVDDDVSFLQMIRDVFADASQGAWEIQTAASGGDALQRLRARKVDLVVLDVFMPGMDGLQLLRVLNQEYPSLPKVLLTGMPDGNTRAAALEGGAALFLEKPASAAGYQSVFATLNELLRWHQRFSSRGNLRSLGLLDLVKLECKSGNSRIFEVFVGDVRGEIWVKEGTIFHAMMPDRRGQSAFSYLTTTPGAVFYLRHYVEPIERSIDRDWEFLVMEAAQIAEQLSQMAAPPEAELKPVASPDVVPASPEVVAPGLRTITSPVQEPPRQTPPPAPKPAPAPAPASLPPRTLSPQPPRAGAPAPTAMETQTVAEWNIAEAPDARPMDVVEDPAGFKVEEMLLCSDYREVLFESHCTDTSKRMRLAEALAGKARAFATQLPLGELDRVELNAPASRMVLRYEARRCLLVRTNTHAPPPARNAAVPSSVEAWLAGQPIMRGVLAAAVLMADGKLHHRSFVPDYAADVSQVIAREAARLPDLAMKHVFPAWQVRFLFTRSQLYVIRRTDGVMLCAFLLRSGGDLAAVQTFFAGFAQL